MYTAVLMLTLLAMAGGEESAGAGSPLEVLGKASGLWNLDRLV